MDNLTDLIRALVHTTGCQLRLTDAAGNAIHGSLVDSREQLRYEACGNTIREVVEGLVQKVPA